MADVPLIAAACAVAAYGAANGPALLRVLPEPVDADPDKPRYSRLAATPRLAAGLAVPAAAATAAVGWRIGAQPVLAAWALLAAVGAVLTFVDWRTRLLPYRIVAPATGGIGALLVVAAAADERWSDLGRAAAAGAAVFGVFFVSWALFPRAVGYGDVRLSAVLGAMLGWHGWATVAVGIYAAFAVGAVVGVILALAKVVDRTAIPFGPFLFVGTFAGVLILP